MTTHLEEEIFQHEFFKFMKTDERIYFEAPFYFDPTVDEINKNAIHINTDVL